MAQALFGCLCCNKEGTTLKIILEDLLPGEEEQVIIRSHSLSPAVLELLQALKSRDTLLLGYLGEEIHRIPPEQVYYFESVDNKVFMYSGDQVMECRQKLYEIEELLGKGDFIRVSKSIVLNVAKVTQLRPAYQGRFEASLDNGERVIISRQYLPDFKRKIGLPGRVQ